MEKLKIIANMLKSIFKKGEYYITEKEMLKRTKDYDTSFDINNLHLESPGCIILPDKKSMACWNGKEWKKEDFDPLHLWKGVYLFPLT